MSPELASSPLIKGMMYYILFCEHNKKATVTEVEISRKFQTKKTMAVRNQGKFTP
jgi:hypothetical protein